MGPNDQLALVDLDSTIADYDAAMKAAMRTLQAPEEKSYAGRFEEGVEPPYLEARRKLIQNQPGFWRNLHLLPTGFEVVDELRTVGFRLHVLTKGPTSTPSAWTEKAEWCHKNLPDALVTVSGDKSLVYGRVLVDDYPPYFTKWLAVRPRGLVVCVAQLWNAGYARGGVLEHPNVFRYDGTNRAELRAVLQRAFDRSPGAPLNAG
jgi:5'(3')-deoxyribonucleotidase